jgi:malate/lactate dehydrogenase
MIWPLTSEAKRLEEAKKKRREQELQEVSGRIRKLSTDIVEAMNCERMLLPASRRVKK